MPARRLRRGRQKCRSKIHCNARRRSSRACNSPGTERAGLQPRCLRGSLSVVPACRQVTHTYTVAAPAGASMSVSDDCSESTRAAPQGRSPESGCLVRSDRPRGTPPGHDRINGRSPGSRVAARHRLPGSRSQWQCGTGSPLTVAGAAAASEHWFHTAFPVRSRVRDRQLQPVNGCGARFVNAG